MKKLAVMAGNDFKQIGRDPMLGLVILGPLLLTAVARWGYPLLKVWLSDQFAFEVAPYSVLIYCLLLSVISLLVGMVAGFLMLDERDEQMTVYYAITPLTKQGYLLFRLLFPTLVTAAAGMIFLVFSDIAAFHVLQQLPALWMLMLETPIFALFLAALAANKVEGMALSKAGGVLLAGPIFYFLLPGGWHWAGVFMPTYWLAYSMDASGGEAWFSAAAGVLYHFALFAWLLYKYLSRQD